MKLENGIHPQKMATGDPLASQHPHVCSFNILNYSKS